MGFSKRGCFEPTATIKAWWVFPREGFWVKRFSLEWVTRRFKGHCPAWLPKSKRKKLKTFPLMEMQKRTRYTVQVCQDYHLPRKIWSSKWNNCWTTIQGWEVESSPHNTELNSSWLTLVAKVEAKWRTRQELWEHKNAQFITHAEARKRKKKEI